MKLVENYFPNIRRAGFTDEKGLRKYEVGGAK
jgi:hypothetical protein